jgi:hypothetical protein
VSSHLASKLAAVSLRPLVSSHLASKLASVSLRSFRPRSARPERPHSTHMVFQVGMPSALSSLMPSIFEPWAITTPP